MPTVSVIIPTYNRAGFLKQAIASVSGQTYEDWELIVADDGSTDETAQMMRTVCERDRRIKFIRNVHRGVSAARNQGIAVARGAYIAFLDDDDLWRREKLELQVRALTENPEWAFVYTQAEFHYLEGEPTKLRPHLATSFDDLMVQNTIALPSVLIRRQVVQAVGGFDETMERAQDVDLWLRVASRYAFGVLPQALTVCRQSRRRNEWALALAAPSHLRTLEKLGREAALRGRGKIIRKKKAVEQYRLARIYRSQGKHLASAGKFLQAVIDDAFVGLVWRRGGEESAIVYVVKPYLGVVSCLMVGVVQAVVRPCSGQGGPRREQPKRVLILETGSGYGGTGRNLYLLIKHLDRRRFVPIAVTLNESGATELVRSLGVRVRVLKGTHGPSAPTKTREGRRAYIKTGAWLFTDVLPTTMRLAWIIYREKVDVVHLNNDVWSTIPGILAARIMGRPIVCMLNLSRKPTRLERFLGGWTQILVPVAQKAVDFYKPYWPRKRFEVVCYPVERDSDRSWERRSPREELGLSDEHKVVGLVGRCVPGKGYDMFLKAAGRIRAERPNTQFLIVGNGQGGDAAYETEMRALAKSQGLNDAVTWAGWHRELAGIFRAIDIFVQSSTTFPEGLPRVVLEAMSHGKAVVASNILGNAEAIQHERTGLLVPPGDGEALSASVLRLLEDPTEAERLGTCARAYVREHFDPHVYAGRLQWLYCDVLGERP